jgi:hypothetical protein
VADIGVSRVAAYEIKKVDRDYFGEGFTPIPFCAPCVPLRLINPHPFSCT